MNEIKNLTHHASQSGVASKGEGGDRPGPRPMRDLLLVKYVLFLQQYLFCLPIRKFIFMIIFPAMSKTG